MLTSNELWTKDILSTHVGRSVLSHDGTVRPEYSRPVSDRPKPTTERQGTVEPLNDDPLHLNKVVRWACQLSFCHEPSNGCGSKNGYGTACIARDTILPSSAHDRSIHP